MTTAEKLTPEDLYMRDDGFRQIADAWPRLSKWKRWEIFLLCIWYVFLTDLARMGRHLARAARAVLAVLRR